MILNKLNIISSIVLLIVYSFRYFFQKIGISNIYIIVFTSFLIIINLHNFIINLKIKKNLIIIMFFILYGLGLLIISIIQKGYIIAFMAFSSIFFNLLFWVLIFNNTDKIGIYNNYNKYIKYFIYFSILNSILAIYQYFIDPTIFGLVNNRIYGNVELLNSHNITRRATGLLGAPQNYSLFMGVSLFLTNIINEKKNKKFIISFIIIIGGLVSGSRAFGVFLILYIIFILFNKNSSFKLKISIAFVFLVFVSVVFILRSSGIYGFYEAFERIILFNSWSALKVFINNIKKFEFINIFFGKGLGLEDWVFEEKVIYDYSSVESYILSILNQMGILGVFVFICFYIKSIIKSRLFFNGYIIMLIGILINICVTPAFNGFAMSYILWPIILYPSVIFNKFNNYDWRDSI